MIRTVRRKSLAWVVLFGLGLPSAASSGAQPPRGHASADSTARAASREIVLVTGDTVNVHLRPDGSHEVDVTPGPGREGVSFRQHRQRQRDGIEQISVVPDDAAALLARGLLDPRLFDVTALVRQGFGRHGREGIPVILSFDAARGSGAHRFASASSLPIARELPSINALAVAADEKKPAAVWTWLTGATKTSAPPTTVGAGASASTRAALARASNVGLAKVWLDGRARPLLDQSGPQVGAPVAHQAGLTGTGVNVAILDTGIKLDHPDLADHIVASVDFTDSRPDADDDVGHGTHVAGIVAGSGAASNGRYVGMAPQARLLNGKVCTVDFCADSQIIAGMEWAAPQARVVNLSIGGGPTDGTDPLSQAVNELSTQYGTLFVIAAGNEGAPASVESPGAADLALTVGSVTKQDAISPFSSRGPRVGDSALKPEIVAPGSGIVAARATGTPDGDIDPVDTSYTRLSGTSMATPHVTGAAALLAQAHPDWQAPQLKAALMSTSFPIAGESIYAQGAGRLDVGRAATQHVFASSGSVEFGLVRWPHDGPPVSKTVTYRNQGQTPVALQLGISFPGRTGPAPAGALTVAPGSVLVPPGGTAEASVTLTPTAVPSDLFGALLTATDGNGTLLRTPMGVIGEAESYDLTLNAVGHSGPVFHAFVMAFNLDTGESFNTSRFDSNGTAVLRLPKGRYDVAAVVRSFSTATGALEQTLIGAPAVSLAADAQLALDAGPALPLRASVDDPAAQLRVQVAALLSGSAAGDAGVVVIDFSDNGSLFAVPSHDTVAGRPYVFRYEPLLSVGVGPLPSQAPLDRVRYNLVFAEAGRIPPRLDFSVRRRELAQVRETFRAQGIAPSGLVALRGNYVHAGGFGPQITPLRAVAMPGSLTQFYTARGVDWTHRLRLRDAQGSIPEQQESMQHYRPGERRTTAWNRAPLGPSFSRDGLDLFRSDGRILGNLGLFSGSEDGHVARSFEGKTGTTELLRDGAPLASNPFPCLPFFDVPSGPAAYDLHCVVDRKATYTVLGTHAEASWTFHDDGTDQHSMPLLAVRVRGDVDELDRAPAGRLFLLTLRVDRQPGTPRAAITSLDLDVSFDDGASWKRVPVARLPHGDQALALVRHPAKPGFVSLRARATDDAGNSVRQVVVRAYQTATP